MSFSLDFRAHSETGPVRKNNQDSAFASPNALVIADGMGGAAAGDLASAVAIAEVAKADERLAGEQTLVKLSGAVARANDAIADLVSADHDLDGMGTTVCGAFFSGEEFGMVHIGDSRGYLLRDGELRRLTHDHSWVQSLIDEGRITEEEAAVHPHRSLVLKVLNGQPNHVPDTELLTAELGDRWLFCSDGLCGFTTDEVIEQALAKPDLDEVMTALVEAAYHGGGADNISIALAQVVPQSDELDARPSEILGAAADIDLPEVTAAVAAAEPTPSRAAATSRSTVTAAGADPEEARYRPTLERKGRWRVPALVALILAVLAGATWGGYAWSQRQYFVGESNGQVAIYRGVNLDLPGITLKQVTQTTPIEVNGLPKYYRDQVRSTISAKDLAAAKSTVAMLTQFAGACDPQVTPTSSPSPSPTPSTTPVVSGSADPSQTPTSGSSGSTPAPAPSSSGSGTPSSSTASPSDSVQPSSASPSESGGSQPNGGC